MAFRPGAAAAGAIARWPDDGDRKGSQWQEFALAKRVCKEHSQPQVVESVVAQSALLSAQLPSDSEGGPAVQRFILQENIALLQRRLAEAADAGLCRMLRCLLSSAQRELALFDMAASGIGTGLAPRGSAHGQFSQDPQTVRQFRRRFDRSPHAYLAVHPGPGLHIVDINRAYAQATMTTRTAVAGRRLFDIFPDNPDDASADGASKLYASLRIAAETGQPHAMEVQRYDMRDSAGHFVERYWRPCNTPMFDAVGRLTYLLHRIEDVTGAVLSSPLRLAVAPG